VLDIVRYGVSGRRLDDVQLSEASLQERWAQAMQVLVQTQAHCAAAFGYEGNSQGVMQYRAHVTQAMRDPETNGPLKETEDEIWAEVLLRAFSTPPKSMTQDAARDFASKVVSAISTNDHSALAAAVADLPPSSSDPQERDVKALQLVQDALFEIQPSTAADFGYSGDAGFVQVQAALVAHVATDPVTMHTTSSAMHALCQKAGVKPPF